MSKVVIADTSCLIALGKIDLLHILKEMYQEVLITPEIRDEYGLPLPEWISIATVIDWNKQKEFERILDNGEASAITLALELPDTLLILDEWKGRRIAKDLNLDIIGTIGILISAQRQGLINDVLVKVKDLINQGFRISDSLLEKLIEMYGKK